MQKDYMPVRDQYGEMDESAFVEKYWQNKWDGMKDQEVDWRRTVETNDAFPILDPVLSALPEGAKVLDGGCGVGAWTLYYREKGLEVTGLDISEATITRLKDKFAEVDFRHGDIRATGFPDDHFDAYFSWGTFEHFENGLADCFAEARRILKPGGTLVISVPYHNLRHIRRGLGPLGSWDENLGADGGYPESRFYQWRLTKAELHREFARAGFQMRGAIQVTEKPVGLRRTIRHDLHLADGTFWHGIAYRVLRRVVPASMVGHMIVGVGVLK